MTTAQAGTGRTVTTDIPARLDRLGWSPFHTRMVAGLGGEGEPGQGDRPAG